MSLVERLRARKMFWLNGASWMMGTEPDNDCAEAADALEHLAVACAEHERLRDAIKKAHAALTKSSLAPSERVYDATAVLSKFCGLPDHLQTSGGSQSD